ncbi:MAG: hypothetical protein LBO74_06275 [Candidatus Symbiothrix sp.]|nr:hypothetical protein [Candidatus Symbiothrix sp.]
MKTNLSVNFLLLLALIFACCVDLKAQVTIGSLLDPQAGALLEFKEREISASDSTTATKGVLFPKVKLVAYDELSPLFATTEEPQKTTSKGMIVYNINREVDKLKAGLCIWDGEKWVPVMSKSAPVVSDDTIMTAFSFKCESANISRANLKKGTPSTGYITIRITAPKSAAGEMYHIETDSVNGVQYEGNGMLIGGTQLIALESNGGTPLRSGIFTYTLSSNSSDPDMGTCSVDIPVVGTAINVLIYGKDNGDFDIVGKNGDRGVPLILQNSSLFGLNQDPFPYCPVEKINVLRSESSNAVSNFIGQDIIIISYNFHINSTLKDLLINFVNSGGVLIQCIEDDAFDKEPVKQLHANFFGAAFSGSKTSYDMFTLRGGNPYVDGIYRNLTGKQIGRDGDYNVVLNLPPMVAAVTDTLAVDALNRPIAIKHKQKPYFVFGDAGVFCGGKFDFTSGSKEYRPLQVSTDGTPEVRTNDKIYKNAYNAHFFTNIIMWAINYRMSLSADSTN